MLSPQLLEILVCPETKQPVQLASQPVVDALNTRIAAGQVKTRSGNVVSEPVQALLVRRDGEIGYQVLDDIPVMLIDEGIPLA
jgi:uncharacterized protein YbaR (Trm112 family)